MVTSVMTKCTEACKSFTSLFILLSISDGSSRHLTRRSRRELFRTGCSRSKENSLHKRKSKRVQENDSSLPIPWRSAFPLDCTCHQVLKAVGITYKSKKYRLETSGQARSFDLVDDAIKHCCSTNMHFRLAPKAAQEFMGLLNGHLRFGNNYIVQLGAVCFSPWISPSALCCRTHKDGQVIRHCSSHPSPFHSQVSRYSFQPSNLQKDFSYRMVHVFTPLTPSSLNRTTGTRYG